MPKPTTKAQLQAEIEQERQALEELLATLSPEQMNQPAVVGEWSVKDVLAHLSEWETMWLRWFADGLAGKTPARPAEGYSWRQLPQLNQKICETYRGRELGDILKQFRASHRKICKTIEGISEQDLFTPGRYAWTGKHALAASIVPNTSQHYRWARQEIRKGFKMKPRSKRYRVRIETDSDGDSLPNDRGRHER